ncbi:MAG: thioredoxin family protein [Bacteroidota bacterium]
MAKRGATSGEQSPEHIEATRLNAQRMARLNKQTEISPALRQLAGKLQRPWTWLILAETWCGDGAQTIPVIAKIADLNSNIALKIILRDEHPHIMDKYLTNGTRSIPKLICHDESAGRELGTWGPRPKDIRERVEKLKSDHPGISRQEFLENLHLWYAQDKGQSVQRDFFDLLVKWL